MVSYDEVYSASFADVVKLVGTTFDDVEVDEVYME